MKKNLRAELHQKTSEELVKTLADAHGELNKMHVERFMGRLHNVANIKEVKRNIARLMTLLDEKKVYNTLPKQEETEKIVKEKKEETKHAK